MFNSKEDPKVTVLESRLESFEKFSRDMLEKLERSVNKIAEQLSANNNTVSIMLEKHNNLLSESERSDERISKDLVRHGEDIDKLKMKHEEEFDKLKMRMDDLSKFRWITIGVVTSLVVAFQAPKIFSSFLMPPDREQPPTYHRLEGYLDSR